MTTYIYTLADPRSKEVRYVGRTKNPDARLMRHFYSGYGHKPNANEVWILELKAEGLCPIMSVVESVENLENAKDREQYWIDRHIDMGCNLLNRNGTRRAAQIPWLVAEKLLHAKEKAA